MEALLLGVADVAAVDNSVLRKLRRCSREWRLRLLSLERVSDTQELGPYPAQPFVVPKAMGPNSIQNLRAALCEASAKELRPLGWAKVVAVEASTYDPIRRLLRECAQKRDLLCAPEAEGTFVADATGAAEEGEANGPSKRQRITPTHARC